jgi:hypothetical protein
MKSIIYCALLISLCVCYTPRAYAQSNTAAEIQTSEVDNLISILSNTSADTSPEQLQKDLIAAIKLICKNQLKDQADKTILLRKCSADQLELMLAAVSNAFGADSPQVISFLAALAAYGVDPDAITIAAILAGIDPSLASQATAAGPNSPSPAPITFPSLPTPPGSGGSGGDGGISEIGN